MSAFGSLVDYSSSDSEDFGVTECPTKRFKLGYHSTQEDSPGQREVNLQQESCALPRRLPLPSLFNKEILQVQDNNTEDPDKHNGRIRRFPHTRGNWSTYVFVPYYGDENLTNLARKLCEECNVLGTFHISEDFHISVSKTFILRFHWINTFISSLRENLQHIPKFLVEYNTVKIYTNEDNCTTFVGLHINAGSTHLCSIVEEVDKALKEFGLPLFYQDPSFHVSVAWCVGDKRKELNNILPKLQVILDEVLNSGLDEVRIPQVYVEHLVCKTGNKVFTLDLN